MQFLQESNIVHEDIKMNFNLEDNWSVRNWYEGFPRKFFSSLRQLIDAFSEDWYYDMDEHVRKVMINHMWEETLGNSQK